MKGTHFMKSTLAILSLLCTLTAQAAFTIGAYNIRNFDYDERYRIRTNKPALTSILKSLQADVLSVEEINNVPEFINYISVNMPGYQARLTECGGAHGQRLGFIYNSATVEMLSFHEELALSVDGGCNTGSRPLAIGLFQIKSTKQKFYGMTAHLKSGSDPDSKAKRTRQFNMILQIMADLKAKTGVIDFYLAGDLNTTEYRTRGSDYQLLTQFASKAGMVNLAQNLPCSAYWWGGTEDGVEDPTLLDHILVTPGLHKVKNGARVFGHCAKVSCQSAGPADLGISYEGVSDHCPLAATIQ
jgi:endonuclease/exonuclease/phosphatase family metal-dependent hydrolase